MKIIATDIANLTDARYFAAWGVDGLAYNIDPSSTNSLSSTQLKEIADWVEGPSTYIKLDGLEVPAILSEVKSNIDIQNIIVGPFIDTSNLSDFNTVYRICTLEDGWQDNDHLILLFSHKLSTISKLQKEKIAALTSKKEVFLDANFTASDLDQIKHLGFAGIILKGGEEEKVGFKSYDELDEILEAIFD
jgi:phosphoribosylanthranilate isomerase